MSFSFKKIRCCSCYSVSNLFTPSNFTSAACLFATSEGRLYRLYIGFFRTDIPSSQYRPHQGISCGNQPPRVAFPTLPSLPPVPDLINPDAWLSRVKGQHLVRRVNRQGFVKVDFYPYYISSRLAGQSVTLSLQDKEQELQVVYPQEYRRSLPLKGLHQRTLPYQEYLALMQCEASPLTR